MTHKTLSVLYTTLGYTVIPEFPLERNGLYITQGQILTQITNTSPLPAHQYSEYFDRFSSLLSVDPQQVGNNIT